MLQKFRDPIVTDQPESLYIVMSMMLGENTKEFEKVWLHTIHVGGTGHGRFGCQK